MLKKDISFDMSFFNNSENLFDTNNNETNLGRFYNNVHSKNSAIDS